MSYVFSPKKAAQCAGVILKLAPDCKLSYMKLIKLLYIADRESIKETGTPITGDTPYAMKHGPVLSTIYDFIMKRDKSGFVIWAQFFEKDGVEIELLEDPGEDELCPYEVEKLQEVFLRFENTTQFELRDLTHTFEEWKQNDPGQSSSPIPLEHIVDAVRRSDDMDDILQRQEDDKYFAHLFEG